MNILMIPAFFRTKDRPTLGSFFWEQARALVYAGHKVTILYSDTYSIKCIREYMSYAEALSMECEGVSIYRKRRFCPLKHGIEGHRKAFAEEILQLYDQYHLDVQPIDIIHAHCCVWAGYAAMRLSEKTGIPYVITEHATLFELHRDQIRPSNERYITQVFTNAAKVICVSHAFAKQIAKYRTKKDIQVIGNVVDFEQFRLCKNNQYSQMRFLTICYMNTQDQLMKKGIDILLKAWREFSREYHAVKLIVGGGGHAVQKAVKWCREYGIEQTVEFVGQLNRRQVAEQMQACDVFVLPSRYETFGVVYIEAMACGKPVIATASGGPDDFVTAQNGVLIPVDDVECLVNAFKHMFENQQDYHADKIRAYCQEKYSAAAVTRQLEIIYREVTSLQGKDSHHV